MSTIFGVIHVMVRGLNAEVVKSADLFILLESYSNNHRTYGKKQACGGPSRCVAVIIDNRAEEWNAKTRSNTRKDPVRPDSGCC